MRRCYGVWIIVRLNVEVRLLLAVAVVLPRCWHEKRMHGRSCVPIFIAVRVVGVSRYRRCCWHYWVISQRVVSIPISGVRIR